MLIVYCVVGLLASALLAGGRPSRLAGLDLRRTWLVFLALGVQVLIVSVVPGRLHGIHAPLHLASYGLLAGFAWSNRAVAGVPVIAFGALCNFAAITANGGVMPASGAALRIAGMPADYGDAYANSAVVDGAHLAWLGDVFAIPHGWPASNVFSIGDVLILVGFAVGIHVLSGSRLARRRTAGAA
jgi:hypothetical protein